jgi:hypothetical protein
MPEYSLEPSIPRFLKVKTLPEGQMLEKIRHLNGEGLNLVNPYNCWLHR